MKKPKSQSRRRFSAAEKSKILKRHLIEHQQVSAVCEEFAISPAQFYAWQAQLFLNSEAVFGPKQRGPKPALYDQEILRLQETVRHKDELIAELMAEFLKAKKKTLAHS